MTKTINQSEFNELINSLKYGSGKVIAENEEYVVTQPLNSWDMNYALHDKEKKVAYLIDIDQIHDNEDDLDEYGGMLFQSLLDLEIEEIKENAWKIVRED